MALGWGNFLGGIGEILGKLPIQGRKERWKNELEKLIKEKENLLKGKCNEKTANRVLVIDERIGTLTSLLKNSAND